MMAQTRMLAVEGMRSGQRRVLMGRPVAPHGMIRFEL